MSNIKLEETALSKLQNIKNARSNVVFEFGNISILRKQLDERESSAAKAWADLQTAQSKLAIELEEKYGKGTVDIETGEFIPTE